MKFLKSRTIVLLAIIVMLFSMTAYAAIDASYYLSSYTAYISKSGNTVKVNFEVEGTRIMDNVGVTEIYLFERTNSSNSWSLVATYLYTNPTYASSMMASSANFKADYVSYSGNSSYQYMAYVTVYAEKDGGNDSRNITAY